MFLLSLATIVGLHALDTAPVLAPNAAPILAMIAAALPVFSRYIVEGFRKAFPSIENIDGKTVSRNVGVLAFIAFAATSLAVAPDVVLPTLPKSADLTDYLGALASLVTALGGGVAWVVNGSRFVHDAIKGGEDS